MSAIPPTEDSDVDGQLSIGLSLRSQGRMHDAIRHLKSAFLQAPTREDIFVLLVGAFLDTRQFGQAIDVCDQFLDLNGNPAKAYFYRGIALHLRQQNALAAECFEKSIATDPQFVDAYINLGNMLHASNEFDRAIQCYQQAIDRGAIRALVFFNLAGSQHKRGMADDAVRSLHRALDLDPNYVKAWKRLGDIYAEQGKLDLALHAYRVASEKDLNDVTALASMGSLLRLNQRLDEAATCYAKALSRDPTSADVFTGFGNVKFDMGLLEESLALHERALQIAPNNSIIVCNYGQVLKALGRLDESLAAYDHALRLDPHYPRAHFNRSGVLLLQGKYEQGFEEYEWRWLEVAGKRPMQSPEWNGEDLANKTILLHTEQGLGDTLQFVRFVDFVKKRSPKQIYVECQAPLYRLLQCVPGIELIVRGNEQPSVDFQLPLMSLPRVLKTRVDEFAIPVPYLSVPQELIDAWQSKLNSLAGFRLGIAWKGSANYPRDKLRSIPLEYFAPIASIPGVQLISLQKGEGAEQIQQVDFEVISFGEELDQAHGPFMDTAALIKNMDLTISIDSSIVHLAGAMGAPTWIMLNSQPDWRWLQTGEWSPWYPTVRIFRQTIRNVWDDVVQKVKFAILEKLAEHNPK